MKEFQYNYIKEWTQTFYDWSHNTYFPFPISQGVCFVLACQSALETGYGTSTVFVENCNLFGMKVPRVRVNLVLGEKNNHASYDSKFRSFQDMFLWLVYNKFPNGCFFNEDEYLCRLQASMFNPSKFYSSKIRDIMNSYYQYVSKLKPIDYEKEDPSCENFDLPF